MVLPFSPSPFLICWISDRRFIAVCRFGLFGATLAEAEGFYSPLVHLIAFFRKTSGQRAVVWINILDLSAASAGEVLMAGDISIVAFCARAEAELDNFPLFFQDAKVSVDGGLSEVRVDLSDPGKKFLRGRMGFHLGEGLENHLPLAAFSKWRAHPITLNNKNDS